MEAMSAIIREQNTVRELYNFICISENLKPILIKFCKTGKGGACVVYSGKKCNSIHIDLNNTSIGSAYVLCHEIAHQILITSCGDAKHGKEFKKICKTLEKKYVNCNVAKKLIF